MSSERPPALPWVNSRYPIINHSSTSVTTQPQSWATRLCRSQRGLNTVVMCCEVSSPRPPPNVGQGPAWATSDRLAAAQQRVLVAPAWRHPLGVSRLIHSPPWRVNRSSPWWSVPCRRHAPSRTHGHGGGLPLSTHQGQKGGSTTAGTSRRPAVPIRATSLFTSQLAAADSPPQPQHPSTEALRDRPAVQPPTSNHAFPHPSPPHAVQNPEHTLLSLARSRPRSLARCSPPRPAPPSKLTTAPFPPP